MVGVEVVEGQWEVSMVNNINVRVASTSSSINSNRCRNIILDRVEHGVDSVEVLEWGVSRGLVGRNATVAMVRLNICMGRAIFVKGVMGIFTARSAEMEDICGRNDVGQGGGVWIGVGLEFEVSPRVSLISESHLRRVGDQASILLLLLLG